MSLVPEEISVIVWKHSKINALSEINTLRTGDADLRF
jgi:hypothetical protein